MDRTAAYYYGDEAGNPVGPLALDEIRKFARAGVVPPDVMVCEAGGENWCSLARLSAHAKGSTLKVPVPSLPTPVETASPTSTARHLRLHYYHALLAALVAFAVDAAATRAKIGSGGVDPNVLRENLFLPILLWSLVALLILLYNLISTLPKEFRFTSPVKGVGFLLIPIFDLYWVFRVYLGLAHSTLRWRERLLPSFPGELRKYGWLVPLAVFGALAFGICGLLGWGEILVGSEAYENRFARLNFLILYFVYATGSAMSFYFLCAVVRAFRRFIDPDSEPLEAPGAARRRFMGQGSPWESRLVFLFFPIASIIMF